MPPPPTPAMGAGKKRRVAISNSTASNAGNLAFVRKRIAAASPGCYKLAHTPRMEATPVRKHTELGAPQDHAPDSEGSRTRAGRDQCISSPSPSQIGRCAVFDVAPSGKDPDRRILASPPPMGGGRPPAATMAAAPAACNTPIVVWAPWLAGRAAPAATIAPNSIHIVEVFRATSGRHRSIRPESAPRRSHSGANIGRSRGDTCFSPNSEPVTPQHLRSADALV